MKHHLTSIVGAFLLTVGVCSPGQATMTILSFESTGSGGIVTNKNISGGSAAAGDSSAGFSGAASLGAFADIDSFDNDFDSSSLTWKLRYLVNDPLHTIALSASDRANVHVFTNFNATSNASANTSLSLTGFAANPFVHSSTSEHCSSTFSDCTDSNWDSDSNYLVLPYSVLPYIVEITGDGFASVSVDTFNGSADGSASASAAWSLLPLPEPAALWLLLPALVFLGWRRPAR